MVRSVILAVCNLVVCRTRIVRPRFLGDDQLCDGFEVVQIEDLVDGRFRLHAKLSLLLGIGNFNPNFLERACIN